MTPSDGTTPETVGIVGLGLIGGSLARALKERANPPRIVASSLEVGDLDRARDEGVVDRATRDAAEVAASAGLVVYATPLDATLELLDAHRSRWGPDTTLTDVVSLKEPVARKVRALGAGDRWIGGHPMAGSEESGFDAARSDLFRGARVYLVRDGADEERAGRVENLWTSTGARVVWMDSREHDRRMIWASHLPQLVANALAATLARAGLEPEDLGPGGRDMTRLAGSSTELWRGLLEEGGEAEERSLEAVAAELDRLRSWLEAGEIERVAELMERTRRWREGEG